MNINTVDLNLFVVFQTIYEARSVTLAGDRLSMTQSAVSNALKRIRERFGDPLFIRTPEGMVPTPLAEMLIGPIEAGLAQFSQAIERGQTFDPLTSDRLFRIALNDVGQMVIIPTLLEAVRERAPGIRLETVDVSFTDARQRMMHGQLDLVISSWEPMGEAFYQQRLFDESLVVLMRKDHPLAGALTFDAYMAANHIAYRPSGATDSAVQHSLQRAGAPGGRKVILTAAHSLGLPGIVATSDMLLTVGQRLAVPIMASTAGLRMEPVPFDVIPFQIRQQWQERYHTDTSNRWLRELVFRLFHQPSVRHVPATSRKQVANGSAASNGEGLVVAQAQ